MYESITRKEFKETLRHYSAYPTLLLMADGESICFECARKDAKYILEEIHHVENNEFWPDRQWTPIGFYAHEEGSAIQCADCDRMIESAYGDPDEEENPS